jgi:hypothetical protein
MSCALDSDIGTHSCYSYVLYICGEGIYSPLEVSKRLLKWGTNRKYILIRSGSCRHTLMCNLAHKQHIKERCCLDTEMTDCTVLYCTVLYTGLTARHCVLYCCGLIRLWRLLFTGSASSTALHSSEFNPYTLRSALHWVHLNSIPASRWPLHGVES